MKKKYIILFVIVLGCIAPIYLIYNNLIKNENKTKLNVSDIKIEKTKEPFCNYSNSLLKLVKSKDDMLVFTSYKQFKDFNDKYKISSYYTNKYNKSYFRKNILGITFKFDSSSVRLNYHKTKITPNKIKIYIKRTVPQMMTMDISFQGFIINIDKSKYNNEKVVAEYINIHLK